VRLGAWARLRCWPAKLDGNRSRRLFWDRREIRDVLEDVKLVGAGAIGCAGQPDGQIVLMSHLHERLETFLRLL
jgi:hypothetical protein